MKKFKQLLFCTILFLSFCFNSYAFSSDIMEAKTGAEVRGIFHELTDDQIHLDPTKFISFFDCDDVLHKISDAVLQKKYILNFLEKLELDQSSLATAFKQISQQSQKEIVDIEILDLIRELQKSNSPVFSLTQCTSDETTRKQRITTLSSLGYDFSRSLPDASSVSFEVGGLKLRFLQTYVTPPVYDRGVIFAGSASKGDTLKAFLNWLYTLEIKIGEMRDLTIVFVDDSRPNVEVVSNACRDLGIEKFVGIHYTAVEQPNHLKALTDSIASFQKMLLKKQTIWLSDTDAGFFFNLTNGNLFNPYDSSPVSHFSIDI